MGWTVRADGWGRTGGGVRVGAYMDVGVGGGWGARVEARVKARAEARAEARMKARAETRVEARAETRAEARAKGEWRARKGRRRAHRVLFPLVVDGFEGNLQSLESVCDRAQHKIRLVTFDVPTEPANSHAAALGGRRHRARDRGRGGHRPICAVSCGARQITCHRPARHACRRPPAPCRRHTEA